MSSSLNSQTPADGHNTTLQINPHRRRKKILKNKKKRKGHKKRAIEKKRPAQSILTTVTMSSWAESFTHAATWQLKQQTAYWKSKATALEYENRLLHDIIRTNYLAQAGNISTNDENISDEEDVSETVEESESSEDDAESDEEFEVSEEFIQFLMQNAQYKEDARLEREKFKAAQNKKQDIIEAMEAMPTVSTEDKQKELQELYGEDWQRIAALESAIQAQFLENCDREKPEYWPNIPLNFNFNK